MQTATQLINGHHPEPLTPTGFLWGAKARSVTASFQLVLGVLEIMLGITVIVLPLEYTNIEDYIGWGIWCGAFSILSGCFGIASRRSKCAVITYMALSIIAAVMCVLCLYGQILMTIEVKMEEQDEWYYDYDETYARSHFIIYVTLAVSLTLQGIASIIGASFTCGAICNTRAGNHRQLTYYQFPQPTQQTVTSLPPPHNAVTTGQPSQCFSNPNLQQSMSANEKTSLLGL